MATAKKQQKKAPVKKQEDAPKARKQWSKKELEKKKLYAYQLFTEFRMEQNVIAEITGISEATISKWKKEEDWDADRDSMNLSPEQLLRRVMRQYNLILTQIESREEGKNFATPPEADSLNKLSDSVKKLQTEIGLGHKAATGKEFIRYMLETYPKAIAVQVMEYWHEFIMNTES